MMHASKGDINHDLNNQNKYHTLLNIPTNLFPQELMAAEGITEAVQAVSNGVTGDFQEYY